MIELSQIETVYNAQQQINSYALIVFVIGIILTVISSVYLYRKNNDSNRGALLCLTPMFVGIAIMFSVLLSTDSNIIDEMTEDYFEQMSCDELRLEIKQLIVTTSDNPDFITKSHQQFAKDLYYYSCEVPLREEVLKLQ